MNTCPRLFEAACVAQYEFERIYVSDIFPFRSPFGKLVAPGRKMVAHSVTLWLFRSSCILNMSFMCGP